MIRRLFFRWIARQLYRLFPNHAKGLSYVLAITGFLELAIGISIIVLCNEEKFKQGWGVCFGILGITGLFALFTGNALLNLTRENE